MLYIVILFLVVFFFTELTTPRENPDPDSGIFTTVIYSLLVLGIVWIIFTCICNSYTEKVSKTENRELISISDNGHVKGAGSGSIIYVNMSVETEQVYSYYYKTDAGGFKLDNIPVKDTLIYEDNNYIPHLEITTTYKKSNLLLKLLFFHFDTSPSKTYKIYIPKDSICRDFSLDAQ